MGAEVSFAYQNIENYEFEGDALKLSINNRRILTLLLAQHIIKNFEEGEKPKNTGALSHDLGIPIRLVNDLVFGLVEAGILSEIVSDNPKDRRYQPAVDINKITVGYVYNQLEKVGGSNMHVTESEELEKITRIYEHIMHSVKESPSNILLKDI